jgi:hypothetical protein
MNLNSVFENNDKWIKENKPIKVGILDGISD